ncbi:cache domain-containing sensor histidine kinase [Cohnella cellulosilytica]|uniref:Sensor histidine kinase n=1 Tax=Cohnella cellulosilytica TaxID=986710 RepID=A0ABW2F4R6_9BACL
MKTIRSGPPRKIGLQTTLILSYILVALTALCLFAWRSYMTTEKFMTQMAQDNVHENITSKNKILDLIFANIRESTLNLLVDKELYSLLHELDFNEYLELTEADKEMQELLKKYFYSYPQIASVALVTEDHTFGYWKDDITFDRSFYDSEIYRLAARKQGGSFYVPTYNFNKAMGKKAEDQPDYPQEMIFSLVRVANFTYITEQFTTEKLDRFKLHPTLVISFTDETYRSEMESLILPEGSEYMVFDADGRIVSHSNPARIGTTYNRPWIYPLIAKDSGVDYLNIDGENTIISYDTSDATGWVTMVTIPRSSLLKDVLHRIRNDIFLFSVLALLVAVSLSVMLTRKFRQSLNQVLKTIKSVGIGNFNVTAKYTRIPEFDFMVDRFNDMSGQIKKLIDENYISKIRQRESEIAILTTQLNPHFLYNTLNVIQLASLNGEHEKTEEMIVALSRMLNYTADNRKEMKPLREDLAWLNQYIYIMKCRYDDDEFQIECSIEEELMDLLVPKLFLQPILENSIIHAFKSRDRGGMIAITGRLAREGMMFTVEDNGDGMSEEQVAGFFENKNEHIGIKNVYQRLQLIYGEAVRFEVKSELGRGTRTTILIPDSRGA